MPKKLFVTDTNVLMHDPAAIFRFQEHGVFIPMIVLEELDKHKKGLTEVARNARQVSRFIDELIKNADLSAVNEGIPLSQIEHAGRIDKKCSGLLFLQTALADYKLPAGMRKDANDNGILGTMLALSEKRPDTDVVLVSKDINMRIKAFSLGIRAEDYSSDEVVDDINLLYTGVIELPSDFWETHQNVRSPWTQKAVSFGGQPDTFYHVSGPLVCGWHPNQFLYLEKENLELIVQKEDGGNGAILKVARNFRSSQHNVWGIQARNREQNFALNALLDPEIDFVTLLGVAGTGKTLITLAAALTQKQYTEIIFTRETVSIGEDIGFLPGTEEEKMMPWMGALLDNLELLGLKEATGKHGNANAWEKTITKELLLKGVKVCSLNFMRGRTFLNRFVILDEAQNLTPKQAKTLVTRAGPGTKVICMGNLGQIDSPYLSPTTSGLAYMVERFRPWTHAAHITLCKGERSRLADFANENL